MAWDQLPSRIKLAFILIVIGWVASTAGLLFMADTVVTHTELRRPESTNQPVESRISFDYQGINEFPAAKALSIIGFIMVTTASVMLLVYTHIEELQGNFIMKIAALVLAILGGIFALAAAAVTLAWSQGVGFAFQGSLAIVGSVLCMVGGIFLIIEIVLSRKASRESNAENNQAPPQKAEI